MTADETGTETPPTPAPSGNGGNGQTPAAQGAAREAQDTRPQLGIRTQYIKDLSFENPSATNRPPEAERAPDIAVNVQVSVRRLDETTFEVTLQITANARHQEKPVFLVELTYAGIFTLVGIPQEALEPTLLVECPRLLFPFATAHRRRRHPRRRLPAAPAGPDRLPRPLSQRAGPGAGAGGASPGCPGPASEWRNGLAREAPSRRVTRRSPHAAGLIGPALFPLRTAC